MKRYSGLVFALVLLVPAVASAQKKPGNNMHTRSAQVYLDNAKKEQVTADKAKFFQQALEATLEGAKTDPDNARVWLLMGQAQIGLGQLAAADSSFDRAQQLYPEFAEEIDPVRQNAWITAYNRGITAIQAGKLEEAIAAMREADMMYRGRPEALVTMAQLHMQTGQAKEAEANFRSALEILRGPARKGLSPEDEAKWQKNEEEVVLRLAGLLADTERTDEAATLYREFLNRQPDNPMAKANLAVTLTRAGKAGEAAPLFNDLLAREDLEGATLFNIGVGLFRAEQYETAARAFERAVKAAPLSHDALYNLSQAIYAHAAQLEKDRTAKPADAAKINGQLLPLYTRMGEVAEQILAIDPANGNVLMMLAHSQRSRGELVDKAKSEEWKRAALATLEKHEALQFDVGGIQVVPGKDKLTVMGRMINLKAAQGSPLKINFMLVDKTGATVGQQEITATAAAAGEPARFSVEIPAPETAEFWKYEIVR